MDFNFLDKPFGKLVPEIGHLHSCHDTSIECENGRYCAKEAARLVEWLLNNISYIQTVYCKDKFWKWKATFSIDKTIIVVTPFQSQKELIKFALNITAEIYQTPELAFVPCVTVEELLSKKDHCNILLFSAVYGAYDNWDYIRDNADTTNAVLSWAKDYCFIFGEQNDPQGIWRTSEAIENFRNRIYRFIPDMLEYPGPEAVEHEDEELFIRDVLMECISDAGYNVIDPIDRRMDPGSLDNLRKAPDGDFEIF